MRLCQDSAGDFAAKSEIRNPKSEGNPKSETRSPKGRSPVWGLRKSGDERVDLRLSQARSGSRNSTQRIAPPRFGFRVSDFGFLSVFGFRHSDFLSLP